MPALLPIKITKSAAAQRKWTLPKDLEGFRPLLEKVPGHPTRPWNAEYRFAHVAGYDDVLARGCVNEIGLALYKGILGLTGVVLTAEVNTNSSYASPRSLIDRIESLPMDQQVRVGTTFRLAVAATELREVHTHEFALPEGKGWTVHPFPNLPLMSVRPGEYVDITATVVDAKAGYGPHLQACCVGFEPEQIRPPPSKKKAASTTESNGALVVEPKDGDLRRALAMNFAMTIRYSTPSQIRPQPLMDRVFREMIGYLRDFTDPSAVSSGVENSFLVDIPLRPGSVGLAMVIARAVYVQNPGIPFVVPVADTEAERGVSERLIRIGAPSAVRAATLVKQAANSVHALLERLHRDLRSD